MGENELKLQFETVLLARITELNGEITEEGLNMAILESILEDKINEANLDRESLVVERLDSEMDNEQVEKNGVYVYNAYDEMGLLFNKHSTIADAIREAISMINALVICNGEVIEYDTLDNDTAYYIDDRIGKVKIVNL